DQPVVYPFAKFGPGPLIEGRYYPPKPEVKQCFADFGISPADPHTKPRIFRPIQRTKPGQPLRLHTPWPAKALYWKFLTSHTLPTPAQTGSHSQSVHNEHTCSCPNKWSKPNAECGNIQPFAPTQTNWAESRIHPP